MPRRVNQKEDDFVLRKVAPILEELKSSPEKRNAFLLFAGEECGGDVFALSDRLKKTFFMKASTITPFMALALLEFSAQKPKKPKKSPNLSV